MHGETSKGYENIFVQLVGGHLRLIGGQSLQYYKSGRGSTDTHTVLPFPIYVASKNKKYTCTHASCMHDHPFHRQTCLPTYGQGNGVEVKPHACNHKLATYTDIPHGAKPMQSLVAVCTGMP